MKSLVCIPVAIAALSSSALADSSRLERWRRPWPLPLPQVYGRENTLPLCEWGHYEADRSMWRFITDGYGPQDWTCRLPGVPGDDKCSPGSAPHYKPTNASYFLTVRDQPTNYNGHLEWPDGSGIFSVWSISCASDGTGPRDKVTASNIEGGIGHVLAVVDGGFVEHLRPALVRGTVKIALPPKYLPRLENDLELAIQVYGDNGWEDAEVVFATVEKTLGTFEVETYVPELSDVRFEIRADTTRGHYGVGYDLRDARIFVETCIPDENNPGSCL